MSPYAVGIIRSGGDGVTEASAGELQALITAASPGATINLEAKIYRENPTINKALNINGVAGTTIKGSDIWTAFSVSGATWVSTLTVPTLTAHADWTANLSQPGNSAESNRFEMVFIDGVEQTQVAVGVTPTAGQFALDGTRHVVLGTNPAGKKIEVVTRQSWATITAANVHFDGVNMTHCGNSPQAGAITNNSFAGLQILNAELSYAHGIIAHATGGGSLFLSNNKIHHGGQQGVGGYQTDITVWGNEIHTNNYKGIDADWAAAGMKIVDMTSSDIQDNYVHDNVGCTGLWWDIGCASTYCADNRVHNNGRAGIHYEVSDDALFENNIITWNGWMGIWHANSNTTEWRTNTLAFNDRLTATINGPRQIAVINADRSGDYPAYNTNTDVWVHNNDIISTLPAWGAGWFSWASGNMDNPVANFVGENNRYYFSGQPVETAGTNRYQYIAGATSMTTHSLASFNTTRAEENGVYMTNTEYNTVIADKQIPTSL